MILVGDSIVLVRPLRSMCAGLSPGMVQSLCIWVSPQGSMMLFIFLLSSSSTDPIGNGTVEHHNVGTTLDLGHHSFQAKTAPIIRTTQGYHHLLMLQLRCSPTISHQIMSTLLAHHLF